MDKTREVVVIGAGGSGLTAAVTAAEAGASVAVFEKRGVPGGTSSIAGGLFAVESKMQRQRYMTLTKDEAFRMHMDYTHWSTNARLVRAFVNESAGTIEWLQQHGVEFIEPSAAFAGSQFTVHLIKGRGSAMTGALAAKAKEKGVEIYTKTPIKKILKDGNSVGGVIAEDEFGKTINVSCKAVIVATGGYGNNREMIKKYSGFDLVMPWDLELTGDGIRMAWEVSAAEEGMGVLMLQNVIPGPETGTLGTQLDALCRQPFLWINQQGQRFCDETVIRDWPFGGNAIARQKNRTVFVVFDDNTRRYLEEEGVNGSGPRATPTTKIVDLDRQIESCVEKGNENVFVAGSLRELANKITIDADVLQETVNEYNKFCDKGHDDLFAKERKYLQPVRQPKFYAFRACNRILGTIGGIRINEKAEALDNEQEVIPGLYAVGNDAGGLYSDSYDFHLPGSALGFAVNSGRIAGKNALTYIGK